MQVIETPTNAQSKLNSGFWSDKRNFMLLAGACLLLFFLMLGSWGFIDPGDGYFSEASREMMERHDYVVPYLNYQIYFSKPILIYWMIIAAYKVFGINEFAARFVSAALATIMVGVVYWTTRCVSTKRAGLLAGLILASSPLVVTFARMSLIDMSFSALLGVALCGTVMTLCTDSRRWWPTIYVSLGLAVLDKGPAAAVLYAIGMFGYFVGRKPTWQTIKDMLGKLNIPLGIVIFSAISIPWYVAVGMATHGLWPQVFFFFENFGRFTGHTNHKVPYWWFYIPVVAYGFFPWMLFLPAALREPARIAVGRWRRGPLQTLSPSADAELLFASWAVGVIVFFSLSMTKLQTYVLPAWPAMAVLVGILLDRWLFDNPLYADAKTKPRYWKWSGVILGLFALLAGVATVACAVLVPFPTVLAAIPGKVGLKASAMVATISNGHMLALTATCATIAVGLFISARGFITGAGHKAVRALVITSVLASTIGSITAYQLGYQYRNADVHRVIEAIKDKPGPVAIFHDFKPSVVFHLQRPVDTFFNVDQLRRRTTSDGTVQYVIAGPKGANELMAAYPTELHTVSRSGQWYLFSTTELVALRLPTLEQSFSQHIDLSGGEFSWGTLPFAGGTKP